MSEKPLVYIEDLVLNFYTYEGIVQALDKVKFYIKEGETIGVVGETGCGKSMTALSVLRLIPPPGKIEGGKIYLQKDGRWLDILRQREGYLRRIRGDDISMVFQDPRSALNPVYTVKEQIGEVIALHRREELCDKILEDYRNKKIRLSNFERRMLEKMKTNPRALSVRFASKMPFLKGFKKKFDAEIEKEVVRLLRDMRIPDPERVANMYPHELSGGMAQRVVIAIALSCSPRILIADEPTTNLDVTVQLQILTLIRELKKKYKATVHYITHDMGVIAEMCDRVVVMYAGNVVEMADVLELFKNPLHPYTKALLECIPRPGCEFKSIEGVVPSLINPPSGCRFNDRCPFRMEVCLKKRPDLVKVKEGHFVFCHLYSASGD
jgi:peptide/nickel transport system ATP-binding protein